jgi:hypothetical protein
VADVVTHDLLADAGEGDERQCRPAAGVGGAQNSGEVGLDGDLDAPEARTVADVGDLQVLGE